MGREFWIIGWAQCNHGVLLRGKQEDFPGGPAVKNLPSNAGDTGLIPALGRLHMPWGNSACILQPLNLRTLEPVLCNKRSHCNEKPTYCD